MNVRRVLGVAAAVVVLSASALTFVPCIVRTLCRPLVVHDHVASADVLVVLGHALPKHGLSSWCIERLDYALALHRAGVAPWIVVSGGNPVGGTTESQRMRAYLEARGVVPERILEDPVARNTWENLLNTSAMAHAHGWSKMHIVTSAYHTGRVRFILRTLGLQATIDHPASDSSLACECATQWRAVVPVTREYLAWGYYSLRYRHPWMGVGTIVLGVSVCVGMLVRQRRRALREA